jgi:hypothetical protein
MRRRRFLPIITAVASLGIVASVLRPVIVMETFNAGPRRAADEYLLP